MELTCCNLLSLNRALANVQAHLGTSAAAPAAAAAPAEAAASSEMEVDSGALPEEVDAKIIATGEE